MKVSVFAAGACALLLGQCSATLAEKDDLKRAKTKKPRDHYQGEDQSAMSKVLNGHLKRAEKNTLPCENWSTRQLQEFMAKIADGRSDELQQVYQLSQDRRAIPTGTLDEHREEWNKLNNAAQQKMLKELEGLPAVSIPISNYTWHGIIENVDGMLHDYDSWGIL